MGQNCCQENKDSKPAPKMAEPKNRRKKGKLSITMSGQEGEEDPNFFSPDKNPFDKSPDHKSFSGE